MESETRAAKRLTLKRLDHTGHTTFEGEAVQEEFDRLIKLGYAAFLNEVQIRSLEGVADGEVIMVPALRGGCA